MGSWTKIIIPIISLSALVISGYSWFLESQRKLRIDQVIELSKEINNRLKYTGQIDSLQNIIIQMEFDKQSYTSNLELLSNWIILFVSILFGVFFIVGYGIFDNKIAQNKVENNDTEKRINERHVLFEKELNELRIKNFKDSILLYQSLAETIIYNNDVRGYIEQMIIALITANEVQKLEPNEHNLSKISYLLYSLSDKLKLYYKYNSCFGQGIIHLREELETYQRSILELSNFEDKDIKHFGSECNMLLNGIIIKNSEWAFTGIKPVDTENQV